MKDFEKKMNGNLGKFNQITSNASFPDINSYKAKNKTKQNKQKQQIVQ